MNQLAKLDAICGLPVGFTNRPSVLRGVNGAYAVRVLGDCMRPVYEPGWLVYVDPKQRAVHGRDVIVYRKGDTAGLIKRFVAWGDDELVLCQLNPEATIRIPVDEVAMCNLIVGVSYEA
jgi:phage repressor protein C with HTH and peptisase S24 domain